MPVTDTATLVISCKGDSAGVDKFTNAVEKADMKSNQLLSTLAQLFSTTVMVRFGQEAVRVFSDLEEETNKFNVVFQGLGDRTSKILKELRANFGLSELAGKRMLAGTGDILTGFGFGKDLALDLAEAAAKLGADLASFSNYAGGAEGATMALTKAMFGEAEPMKMLGVVVNQETNEYKEMIKQVKSTGVYIEALGRTFQSSSDTQAKAITALALAYKQSPNAIGDFVRSQNSIANQSRILSNELIQLKANIGRGLSEGFNEGQQAGIKLLKFFNELSPETQDFITKTGTIATGLFAVKAAMATYNTMQAITSTLTAQNTAGTLAEAKAHEANAKAIIAENSAKAGGAGTTVANPLISIGQQIKANKMQSDLAKHDLYAAKRAKAEIKEIKELEQNYATLLRQRKQLYAMRDMEVMTQQTKNLNAVISGTNRQMDAMNARFRFPTFAAGAAKVRAGLVGIGTAAKGAAVAIGGVAKAFLPMLALSAAIAGIDYLMNRSKRAAEAANNLAEAQYKDALSKSNAVKEEIKNQNELFSTLETLSKYTQLTNEEQIQANDIIGKLSSKYGDLSGSIKIVNGQLVIARDLTKKLSEEQLKAFVQAEKRSARSAMQQANAMAQGFQKEFGLSYFEQQFTDTNNAINNYRDFFSGIDALFGTNNIQGAFDKKMLLDMAGREGTAKQYESIANIARSKGLNEMAERAEQIAEALRKADQHNKNIFEAEKSVKGGKSPLESGTKNALQTSKELEKKFADIKDKFFGKGEDIAFSMLGTPEKIMAIEREIMGLNSAMKDAAERGGTSREQQIKAYEYASQILDLEEQKGELMKQYDAEHAKALEEEAAKQKQIYDSLSASFGKFQETAQSAVSVNSEQSIRLQSRMFLSPGNGLQTAANQAAEAAKKSAAAAESSKQIQESMKSVLDNIYNTLGNMGVSTVG